MAEGFLVFVEQRKGQLRKASFEVLCEAKRQAKSLGGNVTAVLVAENVSALTAQIAKYGPKTILVAEGSDFAEYSTEAYANALSDAIKKNISQIYFCR